jgi:hypothetical protein
MLSTSSIALAQLVAHAGQWLGEHLLIGGAGCAALGAVVFVGYPLLQERLAVRATERDTRDLLAVVKKANMLLQRIEVADANTRPELAGYLSLIETTKLQMQRLLKIAQSGDPLSDAERASIRIAHRHIEHCEEALNHAKSPDG